MSNLFISNNIFKNSMILNCQKNYVATSLICSCSTLFSDSWLKDISKSVSDRFWICTHSDIAALLRFCLWWYRLFSQLSTLCFRLWLSFSFTTTARNCKRKMKPTFKNLAQCTKNWLMTEVGSTCNSTPCFYSEDWHMSYYWLHSKATQRYSATSLLCLRFW